MTLTYDGTARDLPKLQPREKLAGVLGAPYAFAMHKRYAKADNGLWQQGYRTLDLPKGHSRREIQIIDNADAAANKTTDDKRPAALRGQWINAFIFSEKDGFKPKWLFEAYVTDHGLIYVNPNKRKQNKNKATLDNGLILKGSTKRKQINELFGLVNGRHKVYWFVGSRHRLSVKAIDRFESEPYLYRKVTLFTFLPRISMTGLQGTGAQVTGYVTTEDDTLAIPVDSPYEVAKTLHADLKAWQEEQLRVNGGMASTDGSQMDVEPSAENIKDLNRYAVAKFVAHYAHDDKVGAELQMCLASGGLNEAERYAKRFEVKRERIARIVETVAADLCNWMTHVIFRIVHEEMERDEEHILIPDYARCVENLVGTQVGARFLLDQADLIEANPKDPLHKVVFATEPLKGATKKIVGAALADAVIILGTYQAMKLTNSTGESLALIQKIRGHVSKLISADDAFDMAEKTYLTLIRESNTKYNIDPSRIYQAAEARAQLISAKPDLDQPSSVQGALSKIIHLLNVCSALHAYATVPQAYSVETKAARDAVIATGIQTTSSIFRKMILDQKLHITARRWVVAAHTLGFISTAVTVYYDYRTVTGLAKAGDSDAALAMMSSTVLSLTSNAVALAASIFWRSNAVLRLATNIVALAFAIAAIICYFFYVYYKDSDLESFFKNCTFGKHAGLGEDAEKTWAQIPLGELYASWSAQVEAIFALTRGFAVKIRQSRVKDPTGTVHERYATRVYLDPGELYEDDAFIVTWWWRTSADLIAADYNIEQVRWHSDEALYIPMDDGRDGIALVTGAASRFTRLRMPGFLKEMDQNAELCDLTVNIQKRVKGMGKTMTLPFAKYGLQVNLATNLIYNTWEDGKVLTSVKV